MEHGTKLILTCEVEDPWPGRNLTFYWMKDGETIINHTLDNLVFESMDFRSDDGNYTCAAEDRLVMGNWSNVVTLFVTGK